MAEPVRAMPGTVPQNGQPEFRPYVYRNGELTAHQIGRRSRTDLIVMVIQRYPTRAMTLCDLTNEQLVSLIMQAEDDGGA